MRVSVTVLAHRGWPIIYLQRKQLVDNTHNLAGQQRPRHVIILVKGLARCQTAAIHLGIHDLERPNGLEQSKVAILDEFARFQACEWELSTVK
jgi:hypothetical protein